VAIVGFNHFVTTRKEFTGVADYEAIHKAIRTMNYAEGWGSNNDWDALNKALPNVQESPGRPEYLDYVKRRQSG
jgi:hypothetical protein